MEKIGERLREVRKEKGFTLKSLSKKIDYSEAYISQIENGKRTSPSDDFLSKTSTVLDVSLRYLKTGVRHLSDLSDEEYKLIFPNSYKTRGKPIIQDIRDMKKIVEEVFNKDLTLVERLFMREALTLIKYADRKDVKVFSGLLKQYNQYENIYDSTKDMDTLIDEIEYMKDMIEKLFRHRFGLTNHKEGD